MIRLRGAVEATPLPPDEPATAHPWVPREILAHADEMLPYWMGEVERVLAGRNEPVPFGRTAQDEIRTMTVDRDRSVPVAELYSRLASSVERVVPRLLQIDDTSCSRRGLHPTLGEMPVLEIVERFMSGHLEEHCRQLEEALGK
jgi:hypothetical protein